MHRPPRRQALVSIAAGISAGSLAGQDSYQPATFSAEEFDLLGAVVEMIIPATETPGARGAGVHVMLDQDLGARRDTLEAVREGLALLRAAGFSDLEEPGQVDLLTRYSESSGPEREFFDTIKGLTIDAYYSTEVGLVQELGYKGNTYLAEFPGCTDDHSLEDLA